MKDVQISIGLSKDNGAALIDVKSRDGVCCVKCVIKHLSDFLEEAKKDILANKDIAALH